ncbi:hypothetical protein OO17_01815 [Rhodopseudomonas palustris]|uniref:Secreted protein n=1 Tax=Rhodopseudomonas palustris TaxID=1076 RepID=A0A0D7F518_RHOPL|nr:hypothetical protein OO17_01815 [Rhodopseudomonas palustris]
MLISYDRPFAFIFAALALSVARASTITSANLFVVAPEGLATTETSVDSDSTVAGAAALLDDADEPGACDEFELVGFASLLARDT